MGLFGKTFEVTCFSEKYITNASPLTGLPYDLKPSREPLSALVTPATKIALSADRMTDSIALSLVLILLGKERDQIKSPEFSFNFTR